MKGLRGRRTPLCSPARGIQAGESRCATPTLVCGESRNWQLATREIREIKGGFESAVRFQPDFEGRAVAQMVEPFDHLEKAVGSQKFLVRAFDQLTAT